MMLLVTGSESTYKNKRGKGDQSYYGLQGATGMNKTHYKY